MPAFPRVSARFSGHGACPASRTRDAPVASSPSACCLSARRFVVHCHPDTRPDTRPFGACATSSATANLSYRILDPLKSVTAVHDLRASLGQLTATTLRQIPFEPDATREFTSEVERRLDEVAQSWGVKIVSLEIDRQRF